MTYRDVYTDSYTDIYGVAASGLESFGQFRRVNGRLHLTEIGRGVQHGFRSSEGWEKVSDTFAYDPTDLLGDDHERAMTAVAAAWAAHAGDDADTLKTAIHTALDALGYRRPDGTRLV